MLLFTPWYTNRFLSRLHGLLENRSILTSSISYFFYIIYWIFSFSSQNCKGRSASVNANFRMQAWCDIKASTLQISSAKHRGLVIKILSPNLFAGVPCIGKSTFRENCVASRLFLASCCTGLWVCGSWHKPLLLCPILLQCEGEDHWHQLWKWSIGTLFFIYG